MNKGELIKKIKEVIQSDFGLKKDYDILRKNKIGHMTNKIHQSLHREGDKYLADAVSCFIANSDKNTKMIYSNIINSKVKDRLKGPYLKISDAEFNAVMREVIDDLIDEE